jgi:hypothetical protein
MKFSNAPSRINESTSVDADDLAEPALPAGLSPSSGLSAGEKVAMAASAVAWLEVLLEGLKNGTRTWAEWDESLEDGPGRAQVAISRCEAELARARDDLRTLTRSADADEAPGTELRKTRDRQPATGQ